MLKRYIIFIFTAALILMTACEKKSNLYSGAEYIMFSDTLSVYPVLADDGYTFSVPVASTRVFDYDRTIAVEIIDEGSTAIEGLDYSLSSNTLTIPAGQSAAYVEVCPVYDRFNDTDTLSFNLRLVMPEDLAWDTYGTQTKVSMFKSCPFSIDDFTGWCVTTSLFLYSYPGAENDSYQRLVHCVKDETRENTIIMEDWLFDGYDVSLTFDPSDPANPVVSMEGDQVLSDEESVFGIVYGDNRIRVDDSSYYTSYFNTCQNFVSLWIVVYVNDMSQFYGTVGHFYNLMEWVSDEEAQRLVDEGYF